MPPRPSRRPMWYGPQVCPAFSRGSPGADTPEADAMETMVDGSTEPDAVAMLAATRHAAQRPSDASGGTGFPQRGHRRDCSEFLVAIPGIERMPWGSYTSRARSRYRISSSTSDGSETV